MQDGAVFVGQHDGTSERIESFGHARTLDGADIEHLADRHCAAQVRQTVLPGSNSHRACGGWASVMGPLESSRGRAARSPFVLSRFLAL
jgi:hypothetical protein